METLWTVKFSTLQTTALPTSATCVPCTEGCSFCLGSSQKPVWEAGIWLFLARTWQPLLAETDGIYCYRQVVRGCDPLAEISESIKSDSSGLLPTLNQCHELLLVSWPFVTYWFGEIFPKFTPPSTATERKVYELKTVLWVWIMQYGPATFDDDMLDWEQLLAWTSGLSSLVSPTPSRMSSL